MEDNFYQTSSEKMFPPSDKTKAQKTKAKQEYDKEAPIISQTIARLEEQIAFYESVYSVKTENNPEEFMREVAINKRVAAILKAELKRLDGLRRTYGKNGG